MDWLLYDKYLPHERVKRKWTGFLILFTFKTSSLSFITCYCGKNLLATIREEVMLVISRAAVFFNGDVDENACL